MIKVNEKLDFMPPLIRSDKG